MKKFCLLLCMFFCFIQIDAFSFIKISKKLYAEKDSSIYHEEVWLGSILPPLKISKRLLHPVNASFAPSSSLLSTPDILFESDALRVYTIYPNPASAYASIEYSLFEEVNASISVTNLLGNSMGNYELIDSEEKITIPTSQYEGGIYFYTLLINGQPMITKKLIVKHQ